RPRAARAAGWPEGGRRRRRGRSPGSPGRRDRRGAQGRGGGGGRRRGGRSSAGQSSSSPRETEIPRTAAAHSGAQTPRALQLRAAVRVLLPVVPEQRAAPLHLAVKVHRPPPEGLHVPERVARVVELQIDAVVLVDEVELAAVLEVAVLDRDRRLAEVGEHVEELLLHLLELALHDLPALVLLVVAEGEEPLLHAELEGEE